jgi:hypothetical protein
MLWSFRYFMDMAKNSGLEVVDAGPVQHGYRVVVADGRRKVYVTFYDNRNTLVQGMDGPLKEQVEQLVFG